MTYKVGVDTGGTFTDFVVLRDDGTVYFHKVPSTPSEPGKAVIQGLENIAGRYEDSVGSFLQKIDLFIHGTTVATNTVLEQKGPKTALICTENFRDVLYLRDSYKWDRWNLKMDHPKPFVPRYVTLPVEERINSEGKIVRPLSEKSVRDALQKLENEKVKAIAVSLIWSMVNPIHENKIKKIIKEEWPEMYVSISSEVQPIIREWPRTCATVLNVYLKPVLASYIRSLEEDLRKRGFVRSLLIVRSNGGLTSAESAAQKPVYILFSGPAMAPTAGTACAKEMGAKNVITVDMGGTSFDVCVVRDGNPGITRNMRVMDIPTGVTSVEINAIGAGGGSIAWIDKGDRLCAGPQSAGANPGPACYGSGGTEPTVTDADLVLGFLNPDYFLGGAMKIDPELSKKAIKEKIADRLGISLTKAAWGIHTIVNENMIGAIEAITTRRGIDPRKYLLVVGGGAGPVHAPKIAKRLGINRIYIPRIAGEFCAYGMIQADIKHEYLATYACNSTKIDLAKVNALYEELEFKAMSDLKAEGVSNDMVSFERYVDMRYPKQVYELMVPVPRRQLDSSGLQETVKSFHRLHKRLYTYAVEDSVCEFITWRVVGVGKTTSPARIKQRTMVTDTSFAIKGKREVYLDEIQKYQNIPVFEGEKMENGMSIEGPAIVEESTTTVVVFPEMHLYVNEWGNYMVEIG